MMRRFPIVATAAVVAMTLMHDPFAARAEFVNEFNFPEVRDLSHQASGRMLEAIGGMFNALARAERGDRNAAAGIKREVISTLAAVRSDFQKIANEMRPRPLDPAKAPRLNNVTIEMFFRQRGLDMPKDTRQLADIAVKQIETYIAAVEALSFETPAAGRASILRMNNDLHRLMDLGVAISHLADTASG